MADSPSSGSVPRRPMFLARPVEDAVEADKNFAENLRMLREERGISQAALAGEMFNLGFKFHQTTINKIENLERKVSVSEAGTLAVLLDVNLEMLVASDRDSPRWKALVFRRSLDAFIRHFRHVENTATTFVDRQQFLGQALEEWISAVQSTPAHEGEDREETIADLRSRYKAWIEWPIGKAMLDGVREMQADAERRGKADLLEEDLGPSIG